jgi:hypothetical protein
MKQIITIAFLMVCLSMAVQAQKPFARDWMPGFYAGINWANQQFRGQEIGFSANPGWRAGFLLEKPITHRLTLSGTLSYSEMGSKRTAYTIDTENLSYLEFVFKATEYLPMGGTELLFSLGSFLAYGIDGERVVSNPGFPVAQQNVFNTPNYNRWDWGLTLDMGFRLRQGSFVKTGFQTAFSNVYQSPSSRYFNYGFSLAAGHNLGWRSFRTRSRKS